MWDVEQTAVSILACPDDRAPVVCDAGQVSCGKCGRRYAVLGDGCMDMAPISPFPFGMERERVAGSRDFWDYSSILQSPARLDPNAAAWGLEDFARKGIGLRMAARDLEAIGPDGVVLDVAGGAGWLTNALAARGLSVVYSDLFPDHLSYAYFHRGPGGSGARLYVRADYLQMPFLPDSLEACVCIDSIERGPTHDARVLSEAHRILKPGGLLLADFHQVRWGPEGLSNVYLYHRDTVVSLLEKTGFICERVQPYCYAPTPLDGAGRARHIAFHAAEALFRPFVKASRLYVKARKPG